MPSTSHHHFTRLFSKNYGWLRARVSRLLGCQDSAEDIAAEAFMRLLGIEDLAAVREPRALLTTIAKRLMIDHWRRADLERAYLATLEEQPHSELPSPQEHAMLIETLLQLDRLLKGLGHQARQAFIHSLFDGMTYEQIGRQLGISKSRVHQHMEQAYLCCLEALAQ
ncbi:sigma-70 family RNA polymerase sigma factor [Pseudomonas sp. TH05]|uniref:sigma-70 family RNA polymerase sigma factor n=1 Tax=unclassified Pseudomonas TaxID=196821 RepID=UPI000995FFED|nr:MULTISPECIES: sigma-70 family RNA polymerase sigma factor [unclassified Pseudomonas]MBK5541656.1 sigma-70 family RNA polymerase sigma factor [Pseudomonas sp. TH07]MBK5555152.1 sigma-70 family RNA polymerase sigma factor [Pseudomonas sp. TH05]OOW00929.1 RNA polymerase subunit sigma [Pseudomonas sp. MF4836]